MVSKNLFRLLAATSAVALGLAVPAAAQEPPEEGSPEVPEGSVPDEPPAPEEPEGTEPPPAEVTESPPPPDPGPPEEPPAPVAVELPVQPEQEPEPGPPEDPPGNNGTVKVDGEELDTHPDNEPHVGCVFQIDFYGYDEGDLHASVTFTAVPPTPGPVLASDSVFIGGDPAGGGTDFDGGGTYDLSAALAGIEPHEQQGHHVRLDIEAEGSIGDSSKHKEFWVEDCAGPTTTTTTTSTTLPCPATTVPCDTTSTVPPTTAPPTTAPPSTAPPPPPSVPPSVAPPVHPAPPEVAPAVQPEAPVARAAADKPSEGLLPLTGAEITGLVAAGAALLGLGAGAMVLARRSRAT